MKIGIIGIGSIGKIILDSLLGVVPSHKIYISNRTIEKILEYEKQEVNISCDNKCVSDCEYIFICVKPNQFKGVIDELASAVKKGTTIISVAAGITSDQIKKLFNKEVNVIRIMPNTPSKIGMGTNLIIKNSKSDEVIRLLRKMGDFFYIEEQQMDLGSTTSGSLPAYAFYFIDSIISSAVKRGMDEELAKSLVCKTVIGAGNMFLKSDKDGQTLISDVCCKGGSTIEGIKVLDTNKEQDILDEMFGACLKQTTELGK